MQTDVHWLGRILPAPLDGGDRIYSARLAGSLAEAGASVRYYGLVNPDGLTSLDLNALPKSVDWMPVPGRPRPSVVALAGLRPLVAERFATSAYRRMACSIASRADIVVLDQYAMVWALETPLAQRPIVFIAHDFETDVKQQIAQRFRGSALKRLALELNARKTAVAERRIAAAVDLIVTLTEEDAVAFHRIGARRTLVLPPGVPRAPLSRVISPCTPRRVVLLGSLRSIAKRMNVASFIEAADGAFAKAGIGLDIIGEAPTDLRALLEPKISATRFLGFVADPGEALANARIGIVAERTGGGFKLKTIDYMIAGLPVAGLEAALTGVPPRIRTAMLIEKDVDNLVRSIVRSIDDVPLLNDLQTRAANYVSEHFDWSSAGARLHECILRMSSRRSAA